jgi:hypothetical protein
MMQTGGTQGYLRAEAGKRIDQDMSIFTHVHFHSSF